MDNQKLYNIRHSLAHIMAAVVLEMFPKAKLGVGPVIENGFYYDFLLPRSLALEDLSKIEKRMRSLINEKLDFVKQELSIQQAKKMFADMHQDFKVELISDLEKYGTTKAKEISAKDETVATDLDLSSAAISIYKSGKFVDLCKGPNVRNSKEIPSDAFKLNKISGAYWRGNQKNPQLQRIYGLAFETRAELEKYLKFLEEVEKRDHKVLGPQLELFMFHPTAPGMPYWLPKGVIIYNALINFWREEHQKQGYLEIISPILNKKELYITSGHYEHYWENMFVSKTLENEEYGVKAMNCPNAHVVFASKLRSYRGLPLRLGDTDTLHRFELSGTLNGLLRVREFRQDDAHIYISEGQIESEYEEIFKIVKRFYSVFGMKYSFRLGTRPKKFMGDIATWNRAEDTLKKILNSGKVQYSVEEGDGAFYGPKVDILMKDALGRDWQMGTIQLDFQQPKRFGLEYIDKDGAHKTPVIIHRVIYGSMERFIGLLIEHSSGAFPLWISPVQVIVLPISKKQNVYAKKIVKELLAMLPALRIELDDRDESIGKKIRDASKQKIPYMVILGEKEAKAKKIAVRTRAGKDLGQMSLKKLVEKIQVEIEKKK